MTYTNKSLIPGTVLTDTQTTQYTATNVTAIIDKFTATNFGVAAGVLSVNLVAPSGTASNQNIVILTKTLQGTIYPPAGLCPRWRVPPVSSRST
jgi:hypothetical protein